jgi:hypothetical protein
MKSPRRSSGPPQPATVSLLHGGAFTQMIGSVKRTFQVKFLDGDRYQIQFRDEGGRVFQVVRRPKVA